jgi:hypothetical protein
MKRQIVSQWKDVTRPYVWGKGGCFLAWSWSHGVHAGGAQVVSLGASIDVQKARGPLAPHEARFLARHEPGTARIEAGPGLARLGERVGLDRHLSPLGWPKHDPLSVGPLIRPVRIPAPQAIAHSSTNLPGLPPTRTFNGPKSAVHIVLVYI